MQLDQDLAEFKSKELKKALAKGREINMQFAKRMTKLEATYMPNLKNHKPRALTVSGYSSLIWYAEY